MSPIALEPLLLAIRAEQLDGWLFSNFHHRDPLSDEILGLQRNTVNSRTWLYALQSDGRAYKIVHAIEAGILDPLPGETSVYSSRVSFLRACEALKGRHWAVHSDPELTVLSFLDAGTAQTLTEAGLELRSAASLIQRCKGLLNSQGIASHERAATALYSIVEEVWDRVCFSYRNRNSIREGEVRELILGGMKQRGIVTDHPPIVAAGVHSADPHYDFSDSGDLFHPGAVIQLDLWGKETGAEAIYADISWIGFYGATPDKEVTEAFTKLLSAREGALRFIHQALAKGQRPSGAMVDKETRSILIAYGYEQALRHRTGHGIDTECHGSGVNIDSVEFPDQRLLLDGACFSIEPGVYLKDFGLRTEIDVYIQDGKAHVSGTDRQTELLCCK